MLADMPSSKNKSSIVMNTSHACPSVTCYPYLLGCVPIQQWTHLLNMLSDLQWNSWILLVCLVLHQHSRILSRWFCFLGPWSNAIDFIKPLQWVPTRMRSRGRKLHDELINVYGAMILQVKARIDSGEDVPDCLVKTLVETQQKEGLDWEDLCMVSGDIHAGTISTSNIAGCGVHLGRCS